MAIENIDNSNSYWCIRISEKGTAMHLEKVLSKQNLLEIQKVALTSTAHILSI